MLVEFGVPVGLFKFVRLKNYLEGILGSRVDLAMIEAIRGSMRDQVMKEAVRAAAENVANLGNHEEISVKSTI